MAENDPRRIGPFEVLGLLGAGGMGRVFLGRRDEDGLLAAVKVIHAEFAADAAFRERFRREVVATAAVTGRFVAAVVDYDTTAARPWLATEYVPDPSLHQVVATGGGLDEAAVAALGARLADALAAIHGAGLVHRDVKPPNILMARRGPRLIDFGIARDAAITTLTQTGVVMGTPAFMAPEQVTGRGTVGPAADVFALGGVLVFAATGRGPFAQGDPAGLGYRIVHQEPDLDAVPAGLRAVVAACLAKDPLARPTPARVAAALLAPADEVERLLHGEVGALTAVDLVRLETDTHVGEAEAPGGAVEVDAGDIDTRGVPVLDTPTEPGKLKEPAKPGIAGSAAGRQAPGVAGSTVPVPTDDPASDAGETADSGLGSATDPDDTAHAAGLAGVGCPGDPDDPRDPAAEPVPFPAPLPEPPPLPAPTPASGHASSPKRRAVLVGSAAAVLVVAVAVVLAESPGSGSGNHSQADGAPGRPVAATSDTAHVGGGTIPGSPTSSDGGPGSVPAGLATSGPASADAGSATSATQAAAALADTHTTTHNAGGSGGGSNGSNGGSGGSNSGAVATTAHAPATTHTTTTAPAGKPPGMVGGVTVNVDGACFGYCADLPMLVNWNNVSGATSYDLHYTNSTKGVDKTVGGLTDGSSGYVIDGSSSGDELCVQLRAVNKYGQSAWTSMTCTQVPM